MNTDDSGTEAAVTPALTPTAGSETTKRGDGRDNVHPLAAVKHNAYSESAVAPLADAYLAELMVELPTASERILRIQARRLARLELLGRFEDERGVLRNQRRGEPYAATLLAEKISTSYIRTHTDLEAQAAGNGGGGRAPTLAEIAAEYAHDEDGGGES